jgi:hypothetical protein
MRMNKSLPEITYERNLNHNYMILRSCDFFGTSQENPSDFRKRMILENNIEGLLPLKQRNINGELCYYYEINSLQSIDRLYAKKEIGYEELKQLLMSCIGLFERLEEYLLDGSQIILKPEFIYMNIDTNKLYFVCYPEYEGDVREEFREFVDMLLTRIDHTDNNAVMLSYKVYRYTKNPNFVIGEISHIIESTMPKCEERIIPQAMPQLQENFYFDEGETNNANNDETKKKTKKINVGKSKEKKSGGSKTDKVNGKILCLIIAAVSIGIIAIASVTGMESVIADIELYLYGVIAMSLVGAGIFVARDNKKKKLEKEKEALSAPCEDDFGCENYAKDFVDNNTLVPNLIHRQSNPVKEEPQGTTCLHNDTIEERILIGRVGGNDVTIPLTRFPATLGKQAGISDIILDDSAVSKMHARFEEHEGRIYISDLNSTNGTIRNGIMLDINSPVVLEVGDKLRFGRSCFTYC